MGQGQEKSQRKGPRVIQPLAFVASPKYNWNPLGLASAHTFWLKEPRSAEKYKWTQFPLGENLPRIVVRTIAQCTASHWVFFLELILSQYTTPQISLLTPETFLPPSCFPTLNLSMPQVLLLSTLDQSTLSFSTSQSPFSETTCLFQCGLCVFCFSPTTPMQAS